jgi:hypothetical protein
MYLEREKEAIEKYEALKLQLQLIHQYTDRATYMKVDIRSIEYNKKIGILTKLSECV